MLKKILMPTVLVSGTLFACLVVLLTTQGSKSVEVQVDNRNMFYGQLKDVISPPVAAFLTALSLGAGVTTALALGWGQSVRETSELEKQMTNLRKLISEKESQIEELKVSPSNLVRSQLTWFLEEEGEIQRYASAIMSKPVRQEEEVIPAESGWMQMPTTVTQPLVMQSAVVEPQPAKVNTFPVQTAAFAFPSAQSVLGLTRRNTATTPVDNNSATIR
jgi:hypothetical protein